MNRENLNLRSGNPRIKLSELASKLLLRQRKTGSGLAIMLTWRIHYLGEHIKGLNPGPAGEKKSFYGKECLDPPPRKGWGGVETG